MDTQDLLLEKWKMASQLHRHTDNEPWWQEFNYFVGLNSVLLSVLVFVWSDSPSALD
jgi:hypothetical protein